MPGPLRQGRQKRAEVRKRAGTPSRQGIIDGSAVRLVGQDRPTGAKRVLPTLYGVVNIS